MNTSVRDVERLLKENRNLRDTVRSQQQVAGAVRSLHTPAGRADSDPICVECLRDHPCPTLRALDA